MRRASLLATIFCGILVATAGAQWRVLPPHEGRQPLPAAMPSGGESIKPGDKWPNDDKFRWLAAELEIPESIDGKPTSGEPVGLCFNCGDGGEIYVGTELQVRFDNDHPGLAVVSEKASPGAKVQVAVQVYAKAQGGDSFGEARWALIDPKRIREPLTVTVKPAPRREPVPQGIIGLSQGGGMADYEDATAAKLKEGGFRWFRMDNILTNALKKDESGKLTYDWADFDKRVDFIVGKMGADAIFAASYMPQVLDAIPDPERHSAPSDYAAWELLCYQAAKRSLDRGKRVAFWEVWNEVNTGWLKPGPQDTGSEEFRRLYARAIGKEPGDKELVRRFEAYCKLYEATARGVLRADPKARVGGPALASGPMEEGPGVNGKGFALGLMLWCQQRGLPLDFVSWHEYFQGADVFAREIDIFRELLAPLPRVKAGVQSFMITEWNQAWWADRPQDHELGAAWCANIVTRVFIPKKIDRPCFFYVKQNDVNFRGDYSLLMQDNRPKPQFNMAKVFNGLSGQWMEVSGGDGEVSAVAAWDAKRGRLAVVLVNFNDRYGIARTVQLEMPELPKALAGGTWRQWTIDATHSNIWHDRDKPELTQTGGGRIYGSTFALKRKLAPNSITLLEVLQPEAKAGGSGK